ncbi:putative gluconolactonase precursor [Usnea florida]
MARYGSLMPQGFQRTILYPIGFNDYCSQTYVPGDPTFANVANASFLVWDDARGLEILGPNPKVEFMFTIPFVSHEAPVYEPNLNLFFFSALQANTPSQYVVDLNGDPLTLSNRTSNPPINLPIGATFKDVFTTSINTLNASTGEAIPILNNYFGYKFTTIDDLAFAPNGDIWFTDDWYAIFVPGLNHTALPQLDPAVYRFVPSTGLVQMLAENFVSPNGIAFSPDGLTVYITDTSVNSVTILPPANTSAPASADIPYSNYVPWQRKTVYTLDVINQGAGLANQRVLFLTQDRIPDGIKLASNGYIATATGYGVNMLNPFGVPIVRV